jgi:hypothetical protein
MTEARIGRLLAASLHQAIGDIVPQRLDFYETWLTSEGLRDGSIGAAPISGVLGFLRTEPKYQAIVERGGQLAAEWTVASVSPFRRRVVALLPRRLSAMVALRVAAGIVRHVCSTTRATARVARGHARLDVADSIFCAVRESQSLPLCGFYAAATQETLRLFGMPAYARVERCHAVDGSDCVIALELPRADSATPPAMAA